MVKMDGAHMSLKRRLSGGFLFSMGTSRHRPLSKSFICGAEGLGVYENVIATALVATSKKLTLLFLIPVRLVS